MSPVRAERKMGTVWATRAHIRLIEPRTSKHSPGGLAYWARWKDIGKCIKQNKTKQNKNFHVTGRRFVLVLRVALKSHGLSRVTRTGGGASSGARRGLW